MSNPQNPAALLATLLSGLSTGKVQVVDLELDPSRSFEEQFDEVEARIAAAAEKAAAEHREHCTACRTKYEATLAAATGPVYGAGEAFNAKQQAQAMKAEPLMGTGEAKPVYHEVGFMAFIDDSPIPQSFRTDRASVERSFDAFLTDPAVILINRMMGVDVREAAQHITIRPVYDKRQS